MCLTDPWTCWRRESGSAGSWVGCCGTVAAWAGLERRVGLIDVEETSTLAFSPRSVDCEGIVIS